MADLDDFFAKKDKKKKTKKFSKANVDELAKNLEETDKKEQRQADKFEPLATSAALNNEEKNQEKEKKVEAEDDWDDYHENKKDYTGLKIENLKVEEEVEEEEEEEEQMNEDGEMVSVKKSESGPWNKKSGSKNNSTDIPDEKIPEPSPAPLPGVNKSGGYVPPHLRGGNASAPAERRPMARNRVKNAPDINSEVYFPSLSSGTDDAAPKGAWGKKLSGRNEGQFEEVRERQGQSHNNRSSEAPKLSLGNKFDLLTED